MQQTRLRTAIVLLALAYCTLQTLYVLRLPLVMDEFDGAYEAYRLHHQTPYRDFIPYKTVLGYYVESVPARFAGDVWPRILAIKLTLAIINTMTLAGAALYLGRFFKPAAVLGGLALLIACSNFLERSSELRVDMLTGWAGLCSLLLLLPDKTAWSGALCAISFLVSQKGALYFAAANLALVVCWILYERTLERIRPLALFNTAFAAVIAAYAVLWSLAAPMRIVLRSMFFAAAGQAMLGAYRIRAQYWTQILERNPVFFGLSAIAIVMLMRKNSRLTTMIAVYGLVILIEGALYKQPWPYFFPLLLPSLFVVLVAFFDAVRLNRGAVAIIGLGGIAYPLMRVPVALARDNSYQRYNVALGSAFLAPHETYLAGTDILHDHEQTLPELERLDGLALLRLRAASRSDVETMVAAIDRRPPKVVIANYRIYAFPQPLLEYVDAHYARLSGSIFGYAPRLDAGAHAIPLAFSGRYQVDTKTSDVVEIDGVSHRTGEFVTLDARSHQVMSRQPVRLRLLPETAAGVLDPAFVREQPFYPNVYDY